MKLSPQCCLADCDLSFLNLTHLPSTSYSKTKSIWRHNWFFTHYIKDHFSGKLKMSPNHQKAPNRQVDHKTNEWSSRDDSCVISKESIHNCKRSSILKKSLRTKQINKIAQGQWSSYLIENKLVTPRTVN